VQRLFSTFPDGWPGVGLLVLRIATGCVAVAQGWMHLAQATNPTFATWAIGGLPIASGAAVLIGFLTPCTGLLLCATIPLFWFPVRSEALFFDRTAAVLIMADAAALALLGPGAFSIDARLFGRREILIPQESHAPKS
jgi:putative oxidoreductase